MNKLFTKIDECVTLLGFNTQKLDAVLGEWVEACHARAVAVSQEYTGAHTQNVMLRHCMETCYKTWDTTLREVERKAIFEGRMDDWEDIDLSTPIDDDEACTAEAAELARQQDLAGCNFEWQSLVAAQ
jgi:hypothetical protein